MSDPVENFSLIQIDHRLHVKFLTYLVKFLTYLLEDVACEVDVAVSRYVWDGVCLHITDKLVDDKRQSLCSSLIKIL